MFKHFLFLAAAVVMLSSCSKNDAIADASFEPAAGQADYTAASSLLVVPVNSNITTSTTWTSNNVYELDGVIYVKNGATLTINAGTFIKGKPTTGGAPQGALVITTDGTINIQGTQQDPVVFTSYRLLDGVATPAPESGDFAGLIVLGEATINESGGTDNIEGLPIGSDTQYGGSANMDNSGTIKYTRIEFAGDELLPDEEINGLTLGGVGSGTILENIQVSYGDDDSFEFFGGTVNATNLVSFAPADDGFDFDQGYVGTVTNALGLADVNSEHSGNPPSDPDSNGIELDNNGNAPYNQTPQTNPTFNDLSLFGVCDAGDADNYLHGARIRRGGAITLSNAVITGYDNGLVVDSGTQGADPLDSSISDVDLHGFIACKVPGSLNTGFGSRCTTTNPADEFGHNQPFFNCGNIDFSGSPARGAFTNGTGWLSGWTKFDNY